MRARTYNPENGRFSTEDTHWNPGNMIYGDGVNDNPAPNVAAIMQSGNLYVYGMNNAVKHSDSTGEISEEHADKLVQGNAEYILAAAAFGIDPAMIAACICTEQVTNVKYGEDIVDRFLYMF